MNRSVNGLTMKDEYIKRTDVLKVLTDLFKDSISRTQFTEGCDKIYSDGFCDGVEDALKHARTVSVQENVGSLTNISNEIEKLKEAELKRLDMTSVIAFNSTSACREEVEWLIEKILKIISGKEGEES